MSVFRRKCFQTFVMAALWATLTIFGTASPVAAESFKSWLGKLWPDAREAGISRNTFDRVFAKMKPNCKLPGVFCPWERKRKAGRKLSERTGLPETCNKITQPEFLRPEAYFPPRYMHNLALRGGEILKELTDKNPETHDHLLEIERSFRVSRFMLMGLWGRETAFGKAKLNHNGFQALASHAYAGYKSRRGWSRKQLVAALQMVEQGHMKLKQFRSSYAGATGLTQLMPDEFLAFAVDGNRDGKRDILTSFVDSMATTANVLKDRGWHSGPRSWGYEIRLPEPDERFDCTMEDRSNRLPISSWEERYGVKRVPRLGRPEPKFPRPDNIGYLVLPAGARGPAFLVTENFDVLRSYNPSDLYALFVGHLSDRVGCDKPGRKCTFYKAWPKKTRSDFKFSVENLCRLQVALKDRGFLDGTPDGLFGVQTRVAIGRYQKATKRKPDCYPSRPIFKELMKDSKRRARDARG